MAAGMVYFDARLSEHYPTVEIRVADVCLYADDAASRPGLDDVLLNPRTGLPEPASAVAYALLEHVRDALDEAGDTDAVTELAGAVLARGNGAAFQRRACRDGSLASVICGVDV